MTTSGGNVPDAKRLHARPAPFGIAEVSCLPRLLPVCPIGQGLCFMGPKQVPGRADEHFLKAHREPAAV